MAFDRILADELDLISALRVCHFYCHSRTYLYAVAVDEGDRSNVVVVFVVEEERGGGGAG